MLDDISHFGCKRVNRFLDDELNGTGMGTQITDAHALRRILDAIAPNRVTA